MPGTGKIKARDDDLNINRVWPHLIYLHYYRQEHTGEPLSPTTRARYLTNIKQFFKWLTQENYLLYNPASELILPKTTASLPVVLTEEEIEKLLQQPDIATPYGWRDGPFWNCFTVRDYAE